MYPIQTLGSVTLGVTDLDLAVDFYARAIRLEVTERGDGVAFLSGGADHHWIRLQRSDRPGVQRVSFQVANEAALEAIAEELEKRAIDTSPGEGFATGRVDGALRFTDPAGIPVELYTRAAELPVPVPSNGVALRALLHTLWSVPNFDETRDFYCDVLGFRISDELENVAVFLRCGDTYHHSLAFTRGSRGQAGASFGHFCVLVDALDDVMRCRHNAVRLGLELEWDLLRHPTSGSTGVYIKEPFSGFSIEICTGHGQIDDPNHVPRRLPRGPAMLDVWQEPLPPPRTGTENFAQRLGLVPG